MAKTENVQSKVIRVSPVESLGKQIYIYIYMWQGPFGIMRPSSFLIPFVSILVSLSVPNLSPYFSISIAIQFFSLGAFGQRNLLVSRSSLLSPLLSVLRSGGFRDRTQVPSVFVLVSLLHSHIWLFSLGASGAQYAPCPLSVSVLVPLFSPTRALTSLSLSLLFFSLGAYLDTWFSLVPHLSSLVPSNVYS